MNTRQQIKLMEVLAEFQAMGANDAQIQTESERLSDDPLSLDTWYSAVVPEGGTIDVINGFFANIDKEWETPVMNVLDADGYSHSILVALNQVDSIEVFIHEKVTVWVKRTAGEPILIKIDLYKKGALAS